MNVKRRHRGLGLSQLSERRDTQYSIGYYLYELSEKSNLNEKTGKWKHHLASIRQISRVTGYHRNTVRKSLEREKNQMQVIEVYGTNNSRLFALAGSEFSNEVMQKCTNNKAYSNRLLKINPHLKKIFYNWKQERKLGDRVIERWPKKDPIEHRIDKTRDSTDCDYHHRELGRIKQKRHLIHIRNKLAWRQRRLVK